MKLLTFWYQAKLFYEEKELKMVTTKRILAGEQIVSYSSSDYSNIWRVSENSSGIHTTIYQTVNYSVRSLIKFFDHFYRWNVYIGRYGHVDILPLPGSGKGNPADVVEIRADLVLATFSQQSESTSSTERIDWWLEEGGDEYVSRRHLQSPKVCKLLTIVLLSLELTTRFPRLWYLWHDCFICRRTNGKRRKKRVNLPNRN